MPWIPGRRAPLTTQTIGLISRELTHREDNFRSELSLKSLLNEVYATRLNDEGLPVELVSSPYRRAGMLTNGIVAREIFEEENGLIAVIAGRYSLVLQGIKFRFIPDAEDRRTAESIRTIHPTDLELGMWFIRDQVPE